MSPRKRSPRDKDTFTAREVGALLESLRHQIKLIAEGVADLRKEVDGFKSWRTTIDTWRTGVDDAFNFIKKEIQLMRTDLKAFDERLKLVEAKVGL